jgi:DNA (cytosine-5)-methyltransferase 1
MTKKTRTAEHRPATRRRRFRHDDLVAVDLFSGFGGLTRGIEMAGFTTIMAANHNEYKVKVHEANHPDGTGRQRTACSTTPRFTTRG